MQEDVHIRIEVGDAQDAESKVREAMKTAGLHPEGVRLGSDDSVRATVLRQAWDSRERQALEDALRAKGLPGTCAVESTSKHGYQ